MNIGKKVVERELYSKRYFKSTCTTDRLFVDMYHLNGNVKSITHLNTLKY
jgi:hypothetical protein